MNAPQRIEHRGADDGGCEGQEAASIRVKEPGGAEQGDSPLLLAILKAYCRAGIQLLNLPGKLADKAGIALNQLGAGFRVSVLNHQAKCFVR